MVESGSPFRQCVWHTQERGEPVALWEICRHQNAGFTIAVCVVNEAEGRPKNITTWPEEQESSFYIACLTFHYIHCTGTTLGKMLLQ